MDISNGNFPTCKLDLSIYCKEPSINHFDISISFERLANHLLVFMTDGTQPVVAAHIKVSAIFADSDAAAPEKYNMVLIFPIFTLL